MKTSGCLVHVQNGNRDFVTNKTFILTLIHSSKMFQSVADYPLSSILNRNVNYLSVYLLSLNILVTSLITYLNIVNPFACLRQRIEFFYFELTISEAFDKVPHTLLLYILKNFELPLQYITSLQICLLFSFVLVLRKLFFLILVCSLLRHKFHVRSSIAFNFIDHLCTKIYHSDSLLFADDLEIQVIAS